jgi:hypothetical protein
MALPSAMNQVEYLILFSLHNRNDQTLEDLMYSTGLTKSQIKDALVRLGRNHLIWSDFSSGLNRIALRGQATVLNRRFEASEAETEGQILKRLSEPRAPTEHNREQA